MAQTLVCVESRHGGLLVQALHQAVHNLLLDLSPLRPLTAIQGTEHISDFLVAAFQGLTMRIEIFLLLLLVLLLLLHLLVMLLL